MEKLNLEIENKLFLMQKYDINAEELFSIELLFLASVEENITDENRRFFYDYYLKCKPAIQLFDILTSLKEKGIIKKSCIIPSKGNTFRPESIDFNQIFISNYRKYSNELGQEFLSHYPPIAIINGDPYDMHNIAKKYNNYEEFCFSYGKAIGWKQEKHNEIIKLLDWAKQNKCNLINVNVANFVINRAWDKIQLFKDNTYDELIIDTLRDV